MRTMFKKSNKERNQGGNTIFYWMFFFLTIDIIQFFRVINKNDFLSISFLFDDYNLPGGIVGVLMGIPIVIGLTYLYVLFEKISSIERYRIIKTLEKKKFLKINAWLTVIIITSLTFYMYIAKVSFEKHMELLFR